MIKALFFDLDGTLLSGEKKILPKTRRAVEACREKGIKVFLATARSPMLDRMLGWTDAEFALFDGGIYCNGACDTMGEKREYAYLPGEAVRACVEEAARFEDVHLALHVENEVHVFNHVMPDFALPFWGIGRENIGELDEKWYDRTVKVLIYRDSMVDAADALPDELYPAIMARCGGSANIYLADQGKTIIAVNRDVSKFSAIEKLRKKLGLESDEVAVFGDDVHDIEMLSGYENSVAMGNAGENVKAAAKYTTLSNDEEGVAWALEKILKVV